MNPVGVVLLMYLFYVAIIGSIVFLAWVISVTLKQKKEDEDLRKIHGRGDERVL